MKQRSISVLCGGRSKERPGSLRSGEDAAAALRRLGHSVNVVDVLPTHALMAALAVSECAFLALHGRYGEDGKIQGLLETMGLPYTGSGVAASALAMDKDLFKRLLRAEDIPTPNHVRVLDTDPATEANRISETLSYPIVLKPVSEGGSLGITVAQTAEDLVAAIANRDPQYSPLMAEEFVRGTFLTVGLLGDHGRPDVLPVLQVNHDGDVYDYDIKHTAGRAQYVAPASIPQDSYRRAQDIGMRVYLALGCHGPLRVDFMCTASGELFVLEANTIPGLSHGGNLATIAAAAGMSYDNLVKRILASAFTRPTYLP